MKISGLIIIALAIATAPLPALASWDDKLNGEYRAIGECLAEQVKIHGWVAHGPKDEIAALYSGYAETCYDKIKPTALADPNHPDVNRAIYTARAAGWFGCNIDDYMAAERDDEPMTCTDPTTQIFVNGRIAAHLKWKLQ